MTNNNATDNQRPQQLLAATLIGAALVFGLAAPAIAGTADSSERAIVAERTERQSFCLEHFTTVDLIERCVLDR